MQKLFNPMGPCSKSRHLIVCLMQDSLFQVWQDLQPLIRDPLSYYNPKLFIYEERHFLLQLTVTFTDAHCYLADGVAGVDVGNGLG